MVRAKKTIKRGAPTYFSATIDIPKENDSQQFEFLCRCEKANNPAVKDDWNVLVSVNTFIATFYKDDHATAFFLANLFYQRTMCEMEEMLNQQLCVLHDPVHFDLQSKAIAKAAHATTQRLPDNTLVADKDNLLWIPLHLFPFRTIFANFPLPYDGTTISFFLSHGLFQLRRKILGKLDPTRLPQPTTHNTLRAATVALSDARKTPLTPSLSTVSAK